MIPNPRPLVATPGYQKMRDLCDAALESQHGLCFPFTLRNYSDLDECKLAARKFQQLFSSLRARARTTVQMREKSRVNQLGEQFTSPYDKLACLKTNRPDGVEVHILKAESFDIVHEILDPITREPIKLLTPEMRRVKVYVQRIFDQIEREEKTKTRAPTPLTADEELDFMAVDYDLMGELYTKYRWRLKSTGRAFGDDAPLPNEDVDLVDTPMDDFGVGPTEGG